MKLTINVNGNDTVYIKTDESPRDGGLTFVMYRCTDCNDTEPHDTVGYDGPEMYEELCCKIADILLENLNRGTSDREEKPV